MQSLEVKTPLSTIVLLTGFKSASHPFNFDIICHTKNIDSARKTLHHIIDHQLVNLLKGGDVPKYQTYAKNTNRVGK